MSSLSSAHHDPGIREYVVAHKAFRVPDLPDLVPIQVGFQDDLGFVRDNTGDNISERNPSWCELTALYWIWKNDRKSKIIGINHYRRYFEDLKDPALIEDLLKKYDLIVPRPEPLKETVWEQYVQNCGYEKDLRNLRRVLKSLHPEDVPAFDNVMSSGELHLYNMVIMPASLYRSYCAWLFPILFKLEEQTDISKYPDYEKRIYGFLAERLLNVWIKARGLKAGSRPVVQTEQSSKEKKHMPVRRVRNRVQYALTRGWRRKEFRKQYE